MKLSKDEILLLLKEVVDPEIPTISLIDLGVIQKVEVDKGNVKVTMTPTFSGCPATDYMKQDIIDTLHNHGISDCEVIVSYEHPWNSNMISEEGRKALKKHGLAPPKQYISVDEIDFITPVACPLCGSEDTTLRSSFGPTLCRSMHFCNSCRQMFEGFKPV